LAAIRFEFSPRGDPGRYDAQVGTKRARAVLVPSGPAAVATMRANRRVDTGPEIRLRAALHARGLRFRKDFPVRATGHLVRPDVVFTRRRIAVFIDGCFWHRCPDHRTSPRANAAYWGPKLARNVERDRATDRALADAGWTVVRVWEHVPIGEAAAIIEAAVGPR
jgi:DNA mismatch endonuclease (patch repair protein)